MQRSHPMINVVLRLVVAAGLVVDTVVHFDVASTQPPGGPGQLDQSTLFRIEAIVAIVAAVGVVLLNSMWTSLFAILVAGTAFGGVMFSVYVDLGSIGPIPDLYEPVWYPSKAVSAIAEGVALAAAVVLLVLQVLQRRTTSRPITETDVVSSR